MGSEIVQTEFVESRYGKNYVKLLHVKKDGNVHYIKEMEVCTAITLNNHKDYLYGDNSDIVATDTQKNTIYILAKQYGVTSIEKFALLLSNHFLTKYSHVVATKVDIEEAPWKRMEVNGEKHIHAFQMIRDGSHICEVTQKRGEKPLVMSGIRELRVLKTTQSAFTNFYNDEYRTLPDADDRILSTVVRCDWWYSSTDGVNFDKAWETVKGIILETFAGPADKGVFSPSVQNTLYLAEKGALAQIPQIDRIEMTLPNVHYFDVDFKRFPKLEFTGCTNDVYIATDKPSGNIHAAIQRSRQSKL